MIEIDLITGILGSGKTTFIKKYAQYLVNQGKKIAILENDFGAVNIDMALLQELKSDNCQLEMIAGGCDSDCHRRRFKTQLTSLGMQKFDRVLIEPSGIFDMDEFFDTLYESPLDRWFKTGNIFTIADINTPKDLSNQMEYLFGSEAACCGKIIVSKIGNINGDELGIKKNELLSHLNSSMEFIKSTRIFSEKDLFIQDWETLSDADFENMTKFSYRNEHYVKMFTSDDIKSNVHYFMHIQIPDDLIQEVVMGIFNDKECGKIHRIKGSIQNSKGEWLEVNATPERIKIEKLKGAQSVFIVIGDDIKQEIVDSHFKKYNTDKEYISI